jgi:hypothetical protein
MVDAARHPDDPANEPDLHLLQATSFNEAQPLDKATTVMWSRKTAASLSTSPKTMTCRRSSKRSSMPPAAARDRFLCRRWLGLAL